MRPISHKPLWLILAAVVCAAGMWTYANRAMIAHQIRDDAPKADRVTRYLETAGLLLLLLTPVYWFTRVQLQAECPMTLALLALGVALTRRLSHAAAGVDIGRAQAAGEPG